MDTTNFSALSQLDQEYNMLMSSLRVSVSKHLMDEYFTVIWANDYFYERTLYTKEEYEAIYENRCSDYFRQAPEEYAKFESAILKAIKNGDQGYESICRMPQKGGSSIWIRIIGTFTNEIINGYPVIYSTFTDITDVMQMKIDQSVTYENLPGFIAKYRIGGNGLTCLEANQRFLDFSGVDGSRLSEQDTLAPMTAESRAILDAHLPAMRRKEPIHFGIRAKDSRGADAWFQLNGDCVGTMGEDPVYLFVFVDVTDVTEQRELQRKLKDALDMAEKANQAKSDFLARMSHDLRTPINAIVGMTAIAGAHVRETERVLDCLDKITGASRLLLGLINEVLDMAKIESGRLKLSEDPFSLGDTLQELVVMMQPDIRRKGHAFSVRVVGVRHEDVVGDAQRLQQIFMNILSNAVKYTPNNGELSLEIREVRSDDKTADFEFQFEDNGCGMSRQFLEKHLFQPFERAEDQRIREIQGTGLGMSISNNIVRMMGGSIAVESEQGKGSRFTVRIPMKLQKQGPQLKEQQALEALAGLSILIADDDEIACECLEECLEEIGLSVNWVGTGEKAVAAVQQRHQAHDDFFAVFLDVKMPGIDGLEAARRIRSSAGQGVFLILMSAYDTEQYEAAANSAGINEMISKPLFQSRLVSTLCRLANKEYGSRKLDPVRLSDADFTGRRILVAEDNELNQEIAKEIIESTGAVVDTTADGREAVECFAHSEEGTYDMIFLDIQMPVMDGYEATRAIRNLNRKDVRTVPIIAMTANAFPEDVKRALDAGMDGHVPKPIDIKQLMKLMAEKFE